jgi:beta-glucosidase-like glycosyl hydrolase
VKTVGRVSAYEAADDGLNMTWAMVDVSRDPRWGAALKVLVKIPI